MADKKWKVEKFLAKTTDRNGIVWYRIKWKGKDVATGRNWPSTWEPISNTSPLSRALYDIDLASDYDSDDDNNDDNDDSDYAAAPPARGSTRGSGTRPGRRSAGRNTTQAPAQPAATRATAERPAKRSSVAKTKAQAVENNPPVLQKTRSGRVVKTTTSASAARKARDKKTPASSASATDNAKEDEADDNEEEEKDAEDDGDGGKDKDENEDKDENDDEGGNDNGGDGDEDGDGDGDVPVAEDAGGDADNGDQTMGNPDDNYDSNEDASGEEIGPDELERMSRTKFQHDRNEYSRPKPIIDADRLRWLNQNHKKDLKVKGITFDEPRPSNERSEVLYAYPEFSELLWVSWSAIGTEPRRDALATNNQLKQRKSRNEQILAARERSMLRANPAWRHAAPADDPDDIDETMAEDEVPEDAYCHEPRALKGDVHASGLGRCPVDSAHPEPYYTCGVHRNMCFSRYLSKEKYAEMEKAEKSGVTVSGLPLCRKCGETKLGSHHMQQIQAVNRCRCIYDAHTAEDARWYCCSCRTSNYDDVMARKQAILQTRTIDGALKCECGEPVTGMERITGCADCNGLMVKKFPSDSGKRRWTETADELYLME